MPHAARGHPSASAPPRAHPRQWRRIGLWLVGATLAYHVADSLEHLCLIGACDEGRGVQRVTGF